MRGPTDGDGRRPQGARVVGGGVEVRAAAAGVGDGGAEGHVR